MPDINKAYTWAIQTCNAQNIGYSQTYRNQQTVGGVTYYDCSSFINYALLAGGFETPNYAPSHNAFTTYTMPQELLRLGFIEVSSSGEYKPGDIGLSQEHTEMCYKGGDGRGVFMGAHTSGVPLEYQVSIGGSDGNPNLETSFPRIFRYGEGASGYGFSAYVVAALCGNAWRESTINPGINELSGGGGFGIFQWTGDRRSALVEWMTENGYPVTDGDGQLQYLIVEDDWQGEFEGIDSLTAFLNSDSTDIDMLTEAFMTCWERPGVPELEERIEHAHQCYDYIITHANDTSISMWFSSNELLNETQTLNNAVMMYRFYAAGGGGGGTRYRSKRLPVWMLTRRLYI